MTEPGVMIIADGGLRNGKGHPRSTGTFSRVLGRYVRELKALTLMEALAKMTQMPARRLEGFAPMAKRLGRICAGASADLTLFDPARIIDRATYKEPAKPSAGIEHVLVGGTFVVKNGQVQEGATPGRPIRTPIA